MKYQPYFYLYNSKTVLLVLRFWLPLAIVRVGMMYFLVTILYARWLPISTTKYIAMIFAPGLVLILIYPFMKSKPKELEPREYIQLYSSHAVEQRKTDMRRYRQCTLAASVSTLAGTLLAVLLLRFVIDTDVHILPAESFADYFTYRYTDTESFFRKTPIVQAGVGYMLGWLFTPVVRRIVFGKFESPFCSFRLPLPRIEFQSHEGMIADSHLRGRGMSTGDDDGRWLADEEAD